jgi:hypothetical protein
LCFHLFVWLVLDSHCEQEEETEQQEIVLSESEDEDEKPAIYNPKDVPLDFDGKPIPYWLFKLHGLNIRLEGIAPLAHLTLWQLYVRDLLGRHVQRAQGQCVFRCDFSSQAIQAFQKHFQEWKHSAGMRALRMPSHVLQHIASHSPRHPQLGAFPQRDDSQGCTGPVGEAQGRQGLIDACVYVCVCDVCL